MNYKTRTLNIVSLILNVALFGVALSAVLILVLDGKFIENLKWFEFLSAMFVGVISLVMIPFNAMSIIDNENKIPPAVKLLKLCAAVCAGITLISCLVYAIPKGIFVQEVLEKSYAYVSVNFAIPVVTLVSFIFFDIETKIKFSTSFVAAIPGIIYVIFYCLCITAYDKGWPWPQALLWNDAEIYGFDENGLIWLYLLITVVGALALAGVLWLLNKIFQLIIIGYVYEMDEEETAALEAKLCPPPAPVEEKPVEEIKEAPKKGAKKKGGKGAKEPEPEPVQETVAPAPVVKEEPAVYKDGSRVYHISRTNLVGRSWKVKLGNGEKAIKIFNTQKEAIDFAKELVVTQGGSIRVHSMQGKIRKE